ncbi:MAG: GrpB family protein [Candidatus Heimdallarchaeota archaeon]
MTEPVIVEKYNPDWIDRFLHEKGSLLSALGSHIIDLEHIGSTSIFDLAAKPIIDILIGVKTLDDAEKCIPILEKMNYQYVPEFEAILPERRYLRKPPRGEGHDVHLHITILGSDFWDRQLLFRNYLRIHSDARDKYSKLKKKLAKKYRNDREAYTNAKEEFILKTLEKARKEFS